MRGQSQAKLYFTAISVIFHQKRSALEGAGLKQLSGLWGQKKTGSFSMLKHHGQFHVANTYAEIRIIALSCRAITTRNTREAWGGGDVGAGQEAREQLHSGLSLPASDSERPTKLPWITPKGLTSEFRPGL
jgi:hypothetical protein